MPVVQVTAKTGCIYEGQPRPEGDVFPCDLKDARLLRMIGKVDFDDASIDAEDQDATPKSRRTYRRRDMKAEG